MICFARCKHHTMMMIGVDPCFLTVADTHYNQIKIHIQYILEMRNSTPVEYNHMMRSKGKQQTRISPSPALEVIRKQKNVNLDRFRERGGQHDFRIIIINDLESPVTIIGHDGAGVSKLN